MPFLPLDPGWVKMKIRIRDKHPGSFFFEDPNLGSGIRDPGSFWPWIRNGNIWIQDKHPRSGTLIPRWIFFWKLISISRYFLYISCTSFLLHANVYLQFEISYFLRKFYCMLDKYEILQKKMYIKTVDSVLFVLFLDVKSLSAKQCFFAIMFYNPNFV